MCVKQRDCVTSSFSLTTLTVISQTKNKIDINPKDKLKSVVL